MAVGEQLARDLRLAVLLARDAVVRRRREHGRGLVDSRLGLGGVDAAARDVGPVASARRERLRAPRGRSPAARRPPRPRPSRGPRRRRTRRAPRGRRCTRRRAGRDARRSSPRARHVTACPRASASRAISRPSHAVPPSTSSSIGAIVARRGRERGRPRLCESWTTPWTRSPAHCATVWSTGPASRRAERTRRGGSRRSWSARPACSTRRPAPRSPRGWPSARWASVRSSRSCAIPRSTRSWCAGPGRCGWSGAGGSRRPASRSGARPSCGT